MPSGIILHEGYTLAFYTLKDNSSWHTFCCLCFFKCCSDGIKIMCVHVFNHMEIKCFEFIADWVRRAYIFNLSINLESVVINYNNKVIKLSDASDLGENIVVQGGTFYNDAVLRSFETIAGCQAIRPDIAGIMGAFGAALIARERYGFKECKNTTMLSIDEIIDDMGFDAVFVGTGAGLPSFMGIPGEALVGVYSANEYLTRINLMKAYLPEYDTPIRNSKAVAVVGGGNVAMDAARCAKRMGAEHVYIVYRRSEEEAPARLEELHHAKEEGIIFKFLNNPAAIKADENGWVSSMEVIKQELGEPDASGRRSPQPIEGSNYDLDVDTVIIAIGQSPNPLIRHTTPGLDTQKWGGIIVNEETMETSKDGVYAGGDTVTGAATVILAMGAGKKAAAAIDQKLQGK